MDAYVTLLYDDSYLPGALVLGHRLREVSSLPNKQLVVLISQDVSGSSKTLLNAVFDLVINVGEISNHKSDCQRQFQLLGRPELDKTFTKIHAWRLDQFNRCVFLDADTLILKNIDELFHYHLLDHTRHEDYDHHTIAASPDIGWPDIFNSGVFVFKPSRAVYEELSDAAALGESFDGGDQGLLNQYFGGRSDRSWSRLPFTYNVTPSSSYQYRPAYNYFRDQVSIVHFTGTQKPWKDVYHERHGLADSDDFVSQWWEIASRYNDTASLLHRDALLESKEESGGWGNHEERNNGDLVKNGQLAQDLQFDAFGGYRQKPIETIQPAVNHWDPTRTVPPRNLGPEAPALHVSNYENIWDNPESSRISSAVRKHKSNGNHVHFELNPAVYGPVGDGDDDSYDEDDQLEPSDNEEEENQFTQFGPSTITFPWEEEGRKPQAERVFPGMSPVAQVWTPPEPRAARAAESDIDLEAKEDIEEDEDEEEDLDEEMRLGITSSQIPLNLGGRQVNAWDEDPQIQTYVSRHVRRKSYDELMAIEQDVGLQGIEKSTVPEPEKNGEEGEEGDDNDGEVGGQTPSKGKKKHQSLRFEFPVTPNPVRYSPGDNFDEDEEYDSDSSLKVGTVWDPAAKLEELAQLPALLMKQRLEVDDGLVAPNNEVNISKDGDSVELGVDAGSGSNDSSTDVGSTSVSGSGDLSEESDAKLSIFRRPSRRSKRIAELARIYEGSYKDLDDL